jgi:general transcription factor 3C polypeptide 5 (transcription factor C subunit 1)
VPQGPPPDDQRKGKDLKRLEELLRTLFEQRPVWSTVALKANVPPELASKVKRCVRPLCVLAIEGSDRRSFHLSFLLGRALSTVAYHFKSGPWRKMWVRYAYDPRQHPDARVYRLLSSRACVRAMQ